MYIFTTFKNHLAEVRQPSELRIRTMVHSHTHTCCIVAAGEMTLRLFRKFKIYIIKKKEQKREKIIHLKLSRPPPKSRSRSSSASPSSTSCSSLTHTDWGFCWGNWRRRAEIVVYQVSFFDDGEEQQRRCWWRRD